MSGVPKGSTAPIDQDLPEEVRAELDALKTQRLPPSFTIYSHDCPDHPPIDAHCLAPDGIWSSMTLRPYLGWSSGDYHAEILDSPSGEQVYSEHGAAVAGESLTRRFRSWFEQLALPAS